MKRAPVFTRAPHSSKRGAADRVSPSAKAHDKRLHTLHERGAALSEQGDWARAIPILTEALAMAPDEHSVRQKLAHAYYRIGNKLFCGIYAHKMHHDRPTLFNPATALAAELAQHPADPSHQQAA